MVLTVFIDELEFARNPIKNLKDQKSYQIPFESFFLFKTLLMIIFWDFVFSSTQTRNAFIHKIFMLLQLCMKGKWSIIKVRPIYSSNLFLYFSAQIFALFLSAITRAFYFFSYIFFAFMRVNTKWHGGAFNNEMVVYRRTLAPDTHVYFRSWTFYSNF